METRRLPQLLIIAAALAAGPLACADEPAPPPAHPSFLQRVQQQAGFLKVRSWLNQAHDAIDRARVRACDDNGLTGARQACEAQRETVRTLRQMGGVFHTEEIQEILGILHAMRADVRPGRLVSAFCQDRAAELDACFSAIEPEIRALVQPLPAPAPPPPPPTAPPKTRVPPAKR